METLHLYRTSATLPWVQFDCTDGGKLRIVAWDGPGENSEKTHICLNKSEAEKFVKAMKIMIDNYME